MTSTEDPETTGSYLMCRNLRYGCLWNVRWLPGGEDRARQSRARHEMTCPFRVNER